MTNRRLYGIIVLLAVAQAGIGIYKEATTPLFWVSTGILFGISLMGYIRSRE